MRPPAPSSAAPASRTSSRPCSSARPTSSVSVIRTPACASTATSAHSGGPAPSAPLRRSVPLPSPFRPTRATRTKIRGCTRSSWRSAARARSGTSLETAASMQTWSAHRGLRYSASRRRWRRLPATRRDSTASAPKANLFAWARDWYPILLSIGVLASLFAWVCANNIIDWLNRYWSFEARFNRCLSAQSIVLAYQPIVDLRTDAIIGCEVLARWRDVDGTIVSPSRFIDIVARDGRTRDFTQMVADRAWSELSRHVPDDQSMEINFNVFAGDLNSALLRGMFGQIPVGRPALQACHRARRKPRRRFRGRAVHHPRAGRLRHQDLHRRLRHRLFEHRAGGDAGRARREARPLVRDGATRQHLGPHARAGPGDD